MPISNTNIGVMGVEALLRSRRRLHFVGVGGVQMSALAARALSQGFTVTGSDAVQSERLDALRAHGVRVCVGADASHVAEADVLVYSLAIDAKHPEYVAAVALGLPVISRADLLAYFTSRYATRVAVAGAHGKSTTTALLASLLSPLDPTVIAGAALTKDGMALREGTSEVALVEACEYRDSYHALSPTLGVLLSFDLDHVDYFKSEAMLAHSFATFASHCTRLVVNGEDETLKEIAENHPRSYTFGVDEGDAHARDLTFVDGCASFTLMLFGNCQGRVTLRVTGRHNLQNALAAALTAHLCGIPHAEIVTGLGNFAGLARRLAERGQCRGARVIDDYAHHPREIAASIAATRQSMHTGRLFVVFEPHTYSRTKAFFEEIATALRQADRVFITNVYPAREKDTLGVDVAALAARVGAHARASGDLCATARALLPELAPCDVLLVMSAGRIEPFFATLFS